MKSLSNIIATASALLLVFVVYQTCDTRQQSPSVQDTTAALPPHYEYLSDSAWCAHHCFDDTIRAIRYNFRHDDRSLTFSNQHYEFDSLQCEAHLSGEYIVTTPLRGQRNRRFSYDIVLRDTASNIDLTIYELTTDFWGQPLRNQTLRIERGEHLDIAPTPIGGRIYHSGTDYKLWADIIDETSHSRTYCTNKRFTSTQILEFSVWEDKERDKKRFVMKSRTDKPYATYSKSGNLIEIYYYPGNTFFMIDASNYEVILRDYIH